MIDFSCFRLAPLHLIVRLALLLGIGMVGLSCGTAKPGEDGEAVAIVQQRLSIATRLRSFAILADNSISFGAQPPNSGQIVNGGDIGAMGSAVNLSSVFDMTIGANTKVDTAFSLIAPHIKLGEKSEVGDVYAVQFVTSSTSRYGITAHLIPLPPVPRAAAASVGRTDVNITSAGSSALQPGSYHDVTLATGQTLSLGAGVFEFGNFTLGDRSRVETTGIVRISVSGRLKTGDSVQIVPTRGGTAKTLRIEVSGHNGDTGDVGALPAAADVGTKNQIRALILCPAGTLSVGNDSAVTGALAARDVQVGHSHVIWEDGFVQSCGASSDCSHEKGDCADVACVSKECSYASKAAGTACTGAFTCSVPTTCTADGVCPCSGTKVPPNPGAICASNADCIGGTVCGIGNGAHFGLASSKSVCWSPVCGVEGPLFCGSSGALCGTCPNSPEYQALIPVCIPSCNGKTCGGDTSDGCGGVCPVCSQGQAGCRSDRECIGSTVCGDHNGARLGLAPETNACWPPICQLPTAKNQQCGTTSDPCGTCACVPSCSGRQCGDDGCGGTCGTCQDGNFCLPTGTCSLTSAFVGSLQGAYLAATPDLYSTAPAGNVEGALRITEDGQATYRIPVFVPPGRNGLQPTLDLLYHSASGNSPFGLGWQLQGVSAISRCRATRGIVSWMVPAYDLFCLDGSPIFSVSGSKLGVFGSDGTEGRLEIDDGSSIVAIGQDLGGEGPAQFVVRRHDGTVARYLRTAASDVWSLAAIEDRSGNFIEFVMDSGAASPPGTFQARQEIVPSVIRYGGHRNIELVDMQPIFSVAFDYEEKVSPRALFVSGQMRLQHRRARQITVSAGPLLLRQYHLFYNEEAGVGKGYTSRDLLTSLEECAPQIPGQAAGVLACKPRLHFAYGPIESGFGSPIARPVPSNFAGVVTTLDLHGTGKDDILITTVNANSSQSYQLSSSVDGTTVPIDLPHARAYLDDSDDSGHLKTDAPFSAGLVVLDHDADGRDDLFGIFANWEQYSGGFFGTDEDQRHTFTSKLYGLPNGVPTSQDAFVYLSDDTVPTDNPKASGDPNNGNNFTFQLFGLDLDGDGQKDLVWCNTHDFSAKWQYKQAPFSANSVPGDIFDPGSSPCDQQWIPFDVDGDGATELIRNDTGSDLTIMKFSPRGTRGEAILVLSLTTIPFAIQPNHIADVNGDGMQDLVGWDSSGRLHAFLTRGRDPGALRQGEAQDYFYDVGVTDTSSLAFADRFSGGVFDLNNDGRDDLYFDGKKGGIGALSNASDHAQPGHPTPLQLGSAGTFPGKYVGRGDVTGDGISDMIRRDPKGSNLLIFPGLAAMPRLMKVTGGIPSYVTAEYVSATSGVADIDHSSPSCATALCKTPRHAVVSQNTVIQDTSAATQTRTDTRTYTYRYQGGLYGLDGRGWLGFQGKTESEPDTVTTILTRYEMTRDPVTGAYPTTRRPSSVVRRTVLPNEWLTTISNFTYERFYPLGTAYNAATGFPVVMPLPLSEETDDFESAPSPIGSVTPQRRNAQQWLSHDAHGQPTSILTRRIDEHGATVESNVQSISYWYQGSPTRERDWLIAQPKMVTETSTEAGVGSKSRSNAYDYDGLGRLVSSTRSEGDATTDLTTTHHLDAFGNDVLTTRTAVEWLDGKPTGTLASRSRSTLFDRFNLYPSVVVDEGGYTTTSVYDLASGAPQEIHRQGQFISISPGFDLASFYLRDGFGRTRYEQEASGATTKTSYSETSGGALQVYTERAGTSRALVEYNGNGQPTNTTTYGYAFSGQAAPSLLSHTQYDRMGRAVFQAVPSSAQPNGVGGTATVYDLAGRKVSQAEPGKGATAFCYAPGRRCMRTADAAISCELYDAANRTFYHSEPVFSDLACDAFVANFTPSTVQNYPGTTYQFGPFGQTELVVDAIGSETSFAHNAWGSLIVEHDAVRGPILFALDGFQRIRKRTDNNDTTTYAYDRLGRPVSRKDTAGETTWTYRGDLQGAVANTRSGDGIAETFDYAPNGLVKSLGMTVGGETLTRQVQGWTSWGQPNDVLYFGGGDSSIELVASFDGLGHVLAVGEKGAPSLWTAASQDSEGHLYQSMYGNGVLGTRQNYPGSGLAENITTTLPGSPAMLDLSYHYDAVGDLYEQDEAGYGATGFTYDANRRLSTVTKPQGLPSTLHYNAAGDFTTRSDVGTYQYSFPGSHQLSQLGSLAGAMTFQYDRVGNLHHRGGTLAPELTLEYTSFGGTKKAFGSDPSSATVFAYDSGQRRVTKTAPDGTSTWTFDDILERESGSHGTVFRYRVRSDVGPVAQLVRMIGSGATRQDVNFLHADSIGSIRLLTDAKGQVIERRRYDPFGFDPSGATSSASDLSFSGQPLDQELGFLHLGARLYDPVIGRFLSPDPQITTSNSQRISPYIYALNNPLLYVDPLGLGISAIEEGGGGGVGGGEGGSDVGASESSSGAEGNAPVASTAPDASGAGQQTEANATSSGSSGGINWSGPSASTSDYYPVYGGPAKESDVSLAGTFVPIVGEEVAAVKIIEAAPEIAAVVKDVLAAGAAAVDALKVGEFELTNTVAKHLTDFTRQGELARPFIGSPLTVQEIMAGGQPIPDPGGVAGALRWDVPGALRGSEGTWELVFDPRSNTILHFNFR